MPATPISLPPVVAAVPPGALPPPPRNEMEPAHLVASENKNVNDACIERLKELELFQTRPSTKVYPQTKPPGTYGTVVEVQTNVFGINITKEIELFQYSVSIKTDLTSTKEVVFTKKGKEDFVVLDRHEKCIAILAHAIKNNEDFFETAGNTLVYDGQSMLYSTADLFRDHAEGTKKTRLFQINGLEVGHKDLAELPCIKLEVYATKNPSVKFSPDKIGRRTSDSNIESIHGAYHQILEIALNQKCLTEYTRCVVFEHGKLFFLKPLQEGFLQSDCVEVGDGKQMMPGIKKTVQFIEGPSGRGQNNPSVVIDGMKVAFHKEQPVIEKIREMSTNCYNGIPDFERDRCVAVIKGLDCYSEYTGRRRHLKIEGIHHDGAATARFQLTEGGTSTVAQYFSDRYSITLRYPNANLIVCKVRGNINFYPMELICISPNQRVQISQQTSLQSQKTTKESAVLPNVRQRIIATGKQAANITDENQILNSLGVSVCKDPLMINARQFPPVRLAMNAAGAPLQMKDNKWRINHYCRPAVPPQIWALYAVGSQSTRFSPELLRKFGEDFISMCQTKGITLPAPADSGLVLTQHIEGKLDEAAKAGCKFVFVITDDSITNLHQKYKVIENSSNMVVQDMKMSKALSVIQQGKKLTLENVISKTNVKLGGTNYLFSDTRNFLDGVLVIGVGVSNPPPGTKFVMEGKGLLNPMIIGFAYNGKEQQEFSGDFVLSPAGQETMAPIEDIMKQAIEGYKKWHTGRTPKRVIVYRSGCSEGNNGSIMAYEIPLARATIEGFSPEIQLVYITVSKDHTYRFFKKDMNNFAPRAGGPSVRGSASSVASGPPKAWDLNIGPGLSIDTQVTNPACKQFFLNSHITLQGSAKTPLYSVLADDSNAPMAALEEFTYDLCHLHQIVGLPTSLPTPLYVANEYAKRGRNLWNEASAKEPVARGSRSERLLLQEMTACINYENAGGFVDRRVNA